MRRWEYIVLKFTKADFLPDTLTETINNQGSDGWELVSSQFDTVEKKHYYNFKKEIESDDLGL